MDKEDLMEILNGAVYYGIDTLSKEVPLFSGMQETLYRSLDKSKLNSKLNELYKNLNPKWGESKKAQFLYDTLKNYVASGVVFGIKKEESELETKEELKVYESGLVYQIKKFFQNITKPEEQRYFEKTLRTAEELYNISEEKDSEFEDYIQKVNRLPPILDVMKKRKIISKEKIKEFYQQGAMNLESYINDLTGLNYGVENSQSKKSKIGKLETLANLNMNNSLEKKSNLILTKIGYAFNDLKDYIMETGKHSKYVSTIVFALIGFGMILFNLGITGAVISTNIKLTNNVCGGVLLLIATFLFLFSRRNSKTFKR